MTIKINGTNTTAQPSITGTDTDTGLVYGTDEVKIVTDATDRVTVDGSGRLLVGTSSARGGFFGDGAVVPNIQLEVSGSQSRQAWITNVNGGSAPEIILAKSRGTSSGGVTVVQNNDELGMFSFQGADGTDFTEAARIHTFVDGTPGSNDMPGRLVFSTTADGAAAPTERMRISSEGYVTKSTCAAVRVGRQSPTVTIAPNNKFQFNQKGGSYHFDADNLWDTTNHRYTAPVDGLYSVSYQCILETLANGANVIDLINTRINGVNVGYSIRRALYVLNTTGSAGYFTDFFYATYELSAGDTVEFFNGSPSTVVMHANDNYNVLNIYLIG